MQFDPREEGITHINIYSKSNSTLGRVLSNWTPAAIDISIGKFNSVEGLIFYLGSFDNRLRGMVGYDAKTFGEKVDRNIRLPKDVFRALVIEGMESKIKNVKKVNLQLFNQFVGLEMPLTHYYHYDTIVVQIPKWEWQVVEWEKLKVRLRA